MKYIHLVLPQSFQFPQDKCKLETLKHRKKNQVNIVGLSQGKITPKEGNQGPYFFY